MKSVCLYFNVHLPFRLKKYQPGDIDVIHTYEDMAANKAAIDFEAEHSYLPCNAILLHHLCSGKYDFSVSFSFSGIMLEMLRQYRPDVLVSFQQLVDTGRVEILAETYYHSLSFLYSGHEFRRQVQKHSLLVEEIFGTRPAVFRNTALIYSNDLARVINSMGYKGIVCEGVENILNGRSADRVYAAPGTGDLGLLLRNRSLSDDIAFRFDETGWQEYPLTAAKFASWLHNSRGKSETINLFMSYATFGVHKTGESGIFTFLEDFPEAVLADEEFRFVTPSVALHDHYPCDIFDVSSPVSWEMHQDMSCLNNRNPMQHNTLKKIYAIENMVMSCGNNRLIDTWGKLQAADHFYNMTDETAGNYQYSNPFPDAGEAFRNYTNIVTDFEISVIKEYIRLEKQKSTGYNAIYTLY